MKKAMMRHLYHQKHDGTAMEHVNKFCETCNPLHLSYI